MKNQSVQVEGSGNERKPETEIKKEALQSPSLLGIMTEALTQTSRGEDIVILNFLLSPPTLFTPFAPPWLVKNLGL